MNKILAASVVILAHAANSFAECKGPGCGEVKMPVGVELARQAVKKAIETAPERRKQLSHFQVEAAPLIFFAPYGMEPEPKDAIEDLAQAQAWLESKAAFYKAVVKIFAAETERGKDLKVEGLDVEPIAAKIRDHNYQKMAEDIHADAELDVKYMAVFRKDETTRTETGQQIIDRKMRLFERLAPSKPRSKCEPGQKCGSPAGHSK